MLPHTATDIELIRNVRENNCSDSIMELQSRHQGLLCKVAKKYSGYAEISGTYFNNFVQDFPFVVNEAVREYDENREIKFSTYLGNTMKFHCLNTINGEAEFAAVKQTATYEDRGYILPDCEIVDNTQEDNLEYISNLLSQVKNPKIKDIIRLRYMSGTKRKTFKQLSKLTNLSIQGVKNLHDQFVEFVRKKLKSGQTSDII